jgi:hypothetical protein
VSVDIGINFRASPSFVTDGAGETYCVNDGYPTTRGGVTFGWDIGIQIRDRDSGVDRRLAGLNRDDAGGATFRLDLPAAGTYDVHVAAGDASFTVGTGFDLKDGTTTFASITGSTTVGGRFKDATGTERTSWPTQEVAFTHTFSSTILRITCTSAVSGLAHVRVTDAGGGGATIVPQHYYPRLLGGIGGPF